MLHVRSLDAILLSSLNNIRYLTGFTGSNALCVVTPRSALFLTDWRYDRQSAAEVSGIRRCVTRGSLLEEAVRQRVFQRCKIVGFEAEHLSYATYRSVRRSFSGIGLKPTTGIVEGLCLVKEKVELAAIRKAVAITDQVFQEVLPIIKPGMSELDLAAEISYRHKKCGAEKDAFDPIVAGGIRSSLPHARPTTRKIRSGELLLLDFGCTVSGYHSDMTRTVAIGKIDARKKRMYETVYAAQRDAVAAAKGGMAARELDAVARQRIAKDRLGKYFTHSLGHGLGLTLHEKPRVSFLSDDQLVSGMVITIEPGVYIPSIGGVRIEDDVVLTDHGCEVLNTSLRELITI